MAYVGYKPTGQQTTRLPPREYSGDGGLYVGYKSSAPKDNVPIAQDKPASLFWQNPTNVAKYYNLANSYDAKPEWMDDDFKGFISQAYAAFELANQTSEWEDWKPLQPNDPYNQFLQSFAAPPPDYEIPVADVEQPYPVVENPNFLTGGITQEQFDALPLFQQWAYKVFSSPKSAGATIGGIAGVAGGPAGIAVGAGLGAGLGTIGEKFPWLSSAFDKLDYLAEGFERFLGASSLLMTGEVDTWDDLKYAWEAGHLTYDVARVTDKQTIDLLSQPEVVKWTDDELIFEAYDRIRNGENVDNVYESIQERTGFSGEMRDLMGHMIFDPLNILGWATVKMGAGALKGLQALNFMSDYKPLATALDQSRGIVEAAQKYGGALRSSVPVADIAKLDPISKWLGNVTSAGVAKDVAAASDLTGLPGIANKVGGAALTGSIASVVGAGILGGPGAAILGGLSALYGGKKGLMYMVNLTPASRALEVNDNVIKNISNVIYQASGDKSLAVKYIGSLSNTPHQLAGKLSIKSFDAPDAAAIPLALGHIKPKLEAHLNIWEATTTQRDVLHSIAKVLGKEVPDVVKMLKNTKQTDVLFRQIDDAARLSNDSLASKIDDGSFNIDALKEMTDIYVKQNVSYNDDMWYGKLYEMLSNDTAEWAAKWFDVQPEASVMRLSNVMKSAQSLVLLQMSPTYLINNAINNTVTMARDGVFGMRGMDAIDNIWKRIGIKSNKLKQGVGPIGEVKGSNAISEAMRKGDKLDKVSDFFKENDILKKIGIPGNASQSMETWSSAQAMTTGFIRAWNGLWKPGKGFDRIPTQLQDILGPELSSYVHNAIQRGMNKAEIEDALFSGYTRKFIDDVLPDIVKERGGDEVITRNTLHEVNAYEFLREALKGDPDDATVAKAFDDLKANVDKHLDELHTEYLKDNAERIANKLEAEGGMGYLDLFGQDSLGHMDTELEHWRAWNDVYSMLDENNITGAIRRQVIDGQFRTETARYKRFNERSKADYRAIAVAFGRDTEVARNLVANHEAWINNWDTFFKQSQKMRRDFFKNNPKGNSAEWANLEKQLNELYDVHVRAEAAIDDTINLNFVAMAEAQYGAPGGQAALVWRQAMTANRNKMRADMKSFRDSLIGADYTTRRKAWAKFVPDHEQKIRDYYIQARQGAYDMYEAGRNAPAQAASGLPQAAGLPMGFIDSLETVPKYYSVLEQNWINNVSPILDDIRAAMTGPNGKYGSTIKSANLDAATSKALREYLGKVYGQMADTKNVAVKWAETGRDMALLNYNRRLGMDTFMSTVMPYQFWYSHSMFNWALRAIDRPGWLASWARIRAMQQKNEKVKGFPTRLDGKIQFNMPFLPSFMGDTMFADPLRQLFPHELLMQPFQRMAGEMSQVDSRAVYILESWAADETYSKADLQTAYETKSGDLWSQAVAQAKIELDGEFNNPMDFMNAISGPLLPISWAYKFAQGKQDEIGLLPVTKAIQSLTSWATPGGINIEAPLRKALGLPVGGEYLDYYINRELSYMAANGEISADESMKAMIDKTGAAYMTAVDRVGKEQSIKYFASSFAADFFPEGEQEVRALRDEYQAALETGNASEFFEKHPEYSARLMTYAKTPEEMLRKFTIGAIWQASEQLPDLTRKEVYKQLGDDFETNFLDTETRSYDAISTDTLVSWARAMSASLPKTADEFGDNIDLDLSSSEEARIYQFYSDEKDRLFPDIYSVNARYNALPKKSAESRAYLKLHPELIQYWNWNEGIKTQYPIIGELQKEVSNTIYPEFEMKLQNMNPIVKRQLSGYFYSSEKLSTGARNEIYKMWVSMGKPTEDLDAFIELFRSYVME